ARVSRSPTGPILSGTPGLSRSSGQGGTEPGMSAIMELPDEAISYDYRGLLSAPAEEWTAAAQLRASHFLNPARFKELHQRLLLCRSQVAADREMRNAPAE